MLLPDPVLTANVYCSNRLNDVIRNVVTPFRNELGRVGGAEACYFWIMRYSRGGEHLKIRLHGPECWKPKAADLLAGAAASYLAGLGPPGDDEPQSQRKTATPIDLEDRVDHPDRTFSWTTYQRSHVSLGYRPYLDDPLYVACLTRCLADGTDIVLKSFDRAGQGEVGFTLLQSALLKALISGLAAVDALRTDLATYCLYHRDWLLRHAFKQSGGLGGIGKLTEIIVKFNSQAETMGQGLGRIENAVAARLDSVAGRDWESQPGSPWETSLRALEGALVRPESSRCWVDPFAESWTFPAFFKVLHGFANQLGFSLLNEAFVYHLLAFVRGGRLHQRPVHLSPPVL